MNLRPELIEVTGAARKRTQEKQIEESTIVRLHHVLMKEYGWIPFSEFTGVDEKIPIELEVPEIKIGNVVVSPFKLKGKIHIKRKALPILIALNLINEIQKDRDEENKEYTKLKRMGKRVRMPRKH